MSRAAWRVGQLVSCWVTRDGVEQAVAARQKGYAYRGFARWPAAGGGVADPGMQLWLYEFAREHADPVDGSREPSARCRLVRPMASGHVHVVERTGRSICSGDWPTAVVGWSV